ncbi:hypothetical protein GYMLUDRAFT_87156 [Collybiopsis luxurians FD-317 M1]|uniref:Unplaced genomic scaffold GYMLUscaffold_46, whole genome shotgun sequence n=1 Tax=Collybiopsis luxurians FD-317 M1 TaxID=944289 RepID=A0A0D0BPC4_9AGAR|nr:hypothetical protein GYMLUDRAFT_87156 [Collybiopsis luxurians FD-317 M1]
MPCPPPETSQNCSPEEFTGASDNSAAQQLDLLVRLRVLEHLQNTLGYPIPVQQDTQSLTEQVVLDVLDWIAQCYALNPSDAVTVAVSTRPGIVTLHLCHDDVKSAIQTSKVFLAMLRTVLNFDENTNSSSVIAPIFQMVVNMAYPRILHKVSRIGITDGGPDDTAHHFTSLVTAWMLFRPGGEQSRGFVKVATNYAGTTARTTEYMVQSFITIVEQCNAGARCKDMNEQKRFSYLSSIVVACNLLINSTFFNDLHNHESFRSSLRVEDRLFLHKIFRRLSYIASYKSGAAKFAFLGVPYLRQVLGQDGVKNFANGRDGSIRVELATYFDASKVPAIPTKSFSWPSEPPVDHLPGLFNVSFDNSHSPSSSPRHSRDTSNASGYSTSSNSTEASAHARSILAHLDNELRYEILHSEMVAEAWTPGGTASVRCHPELQLIQYLEHCGINVAYSAIGMSKLACWACARYVDCLNLDAEYIEDDRVEGEIAPKLRWIMREGGGGKVKCDWMIPSMAKVEMMDMLMDDTQRELERVIHEVVLDYYI